MGCNSDNTIRIPRYNTGTICASIYGLSSVTGFGATFNVTKDYDSLVLSRDCSILATSDPSTFVLKYDIGTYDISMAALEYLYSYNLDSSTDHYEPIADKFIVMPSVKYGRTKLL